MKHILKAQQFSPEWLERLFVQTDVAKELLKTDAGEALLRPLLARKRIILFFAEASTRTRFSFEAAARSLGMECLVSENAGEFSSLVKGETVGHTALVLAQCRTNAIVVRHRVEGTAERMASALDRAGMQVHVINAGDGAGQHPTQSLLDLYTISRHFGRLNNLTVMLGGDLRNGRTIRSLCYLLSKFPGNQVLFAAPQRLAMCEDILEHLRDRSVPSASLGMSFRDQLRHCDVVYWTRTQTERLGELSSEVRRQIEAEASSFRLSRCDVDMMKPGSILMHPLPINHDAREIASDVDDHPRAVYLKEQAANGYPLRVALLASLFDQDLSVLKL